ncbi:MAG: LysR family transcriptional regulator [Bryobacteraceae bacterium]|nr:LysR family transcriptional regulator [Bryobacteraceae bacterium]
MNLQELRYFVAVAETRHFGRAARACHVTQPTLSGQIRKLEEDLGVALFERTNKRVALTPAGEQALEHAKRALEEANLVRAVAQASRDPLAGPLRLGAIPTLAPYLMPLVLGPLRKSYPKLGIELWEDLTHTLLDLLRAHRLDAALIATATADPELTSVPLLVEPFLAALPHRHRLVSRRAIDERELADDLLVLADGHCLAVQTLSACGRKSPARSAFQAASLDTLLNLVAAGYGATLIPGLAAERLTGRNIVLRPLAGGAARTVRLASRRTFPRPEALRAIEKVVRAAISRRSDASRGFAYLAESEE